MRSLRHVASSLRVFQGDDSLQALEGASERLGCRKALVFCGRSLARPGGGVERVVAALGPRCAGVYAGVQAHSPLPAVLDAARALADAGADAVVAVGGGSAIVTARVASILLAEGPQAHQLCTRRAEDGSLFSPKLPAPKLPQLLVPTTPTTACAKAGGAVFDPASGQRLAFFDPKVRAHAICIDPELVRSAPVALVQSACLNTLTMAVEGLESPRAQPLSDAPLMHALRLLSAHLPLLAGAPADAALRADLVLAALLCGQGTDQAGGGLASVLGHALGARFHLDNGIVDAIVLPHTMRFNAPSTAAGHERLLSALGAVAGAPGPHAEAAIGAVQALLAAVAVPTRLRDVGVPRERLAEVAEESMRDWFLQSNPRRVRDVSEVLAVLEAAW